MRFCITVIRLTEKDQYRTKRNLIIFVALVIGLAVLAGIIDPLTVPPDAEPGTPGLGRALWIISPFAVMLLLRLFGGDGWADLGLRLNFKGNRFWWLVSILVFPVSIMVTLLFGYLFGVLTLDVNRFGGVAAMLSILLISSLVKNIFEEFAWRGYLAPKVYSLNKNIWLSHAFVGLVWGVWHLPFVYVFWLYLTPEMLWYFVPLLLLGAISQSVVYGEIRLATDSVLPAWIMHTIGGTLGNALLVGGIVQLRSGWELLITPGAEGIVGIITMFAVGYLLHGRRVKALRSG